MRQPFILLLSLSLLACGPELNVVSSVDDERASSEHALTISRITFGDSSTAEKVKTIPPDPESFGLRVFGQQIPFTQPSLISVVLRQRGKTLVVHRFPAEGRINALSTAERLILNVPLRNVAAGQYDVGVQIGQVLSPRLPLTVERPAAPAPVACAGFKLP